MKTKVVLPPPGNYERVDMYSRKRWRRVQYLANVFWSRWKREYLQFLQLRNKWVKPHRNLQVNDIVIVKDDTLARNNWKLGKIVEVSSDEDGLVRKVKVMMSDSKLNNQGKRTQDITFIERPIYKLIRHKVNCSLNLGEPCKCHSIIYTCILIFCTFILMKI